MDNIGVDLDGSFNVIKLYYPHGKEYLFTTKDLGGHVLQGTRSCREDGFGDKILLARGR